MSDLKKIIKANIESLFTEDKYFGDMESAFGVDKELSVKEKEQFDDMEETGVEKNGKTMSHKQVNGEKEVADASKQTGKDAVAYYKETAKKMKKFQTPSEKDQKPSQIGEGLKNEQKINEVAGLAIIGGIAALGIAAKWAAGKVKTHLLNKKFKKTGEKEEITNAEGKTVSVMYGYETKNGNHYWGVNVQGGDGDEGYNEENTFLFKDEKAKDVKDYLSKGGTPHEPGGLDGGGGYSPDNVGPFKSDQRISRGTNESIEDTPKVDREEASDDVDAYEVEALGAGKMSGLKYDDEDSEQYKAFEDRNDAEMEGDTTYEKIKKNGKKYKDYKYDKPDEYHNSPKVRVKESVISEAINEDMGGFIKSKVIPKIKEAGIQILPLITGEMSKEATEKVKGFENGSAISFKDNYNENYSNMVVIIVNVSKKDVLNSIIKHFGITDGKAKTKTISDDGGWDDGKQVGGGSTTNNGDIVLDQEPHNDMGVWKVRLYTVRKEETTNENKKTKKMEYTDVIEENIFKANGKLISEEQVLKIANKVPSRVKIDESVFAITDGDNYYRLMWEGDEPVITHSKNTKVVSESISKMKAMWEFNTKDSHSTKKNITESGDDAFKRMFKQMRETEGLVGEKTLNESVDLRNISQDGKFKEGVFLVPSMSYNDEERIKDARLKPMKIEKEEGNRDQLHLVDSKGNEKVYGIDDGIVADLITYEEALEKNK